VAESEFTVDVRTTDGHTVVAPRGDIDAYTGPSLTEHLDAALARAAGDVTLDLSDVQFVDSSGIAVFVVAAKKLRDREQSLVVVSPPAAVSKVLEMTGVTKLVRVER
jgi:anti-sigma B factor antagonist